MIFIGYSNQDRYSIVEPIVFHLKNYGINVWYDFHDMFLSDCRLETNFNHGIGDSKYVIFIISHNFFTSNCAVEELDYAQTLYEQGKITLFPILFQITMIQLPEHYSWIKKIIYNEVNEHSGTLFVTNQIIEKLLYDRVKNSKFRSYSEISKSLSFYESSFLRNIVETYISLDLSNYSARIAILYSIYLYISDHKDVEDYANIIIKKVFNFTLLNISLDHLTFNIFQLALLLLINDFLLLT